MKELFESLEKRCENLGHRELYDEVADFVDKILITDKNLLQVEKKWESNGTWKSEGWAYQYHFGEILKKLIEKATTGRITHDEEKEFSIEEFREDLENEIYDYIY